MRASLAGFGVAVFLLLTAACGTPPEVVQGKVVSYDPAKKILVIEEETRGRLELSLADAEIGGEPVAGDVVRVACLPQNGILTATRVMNISKQSDTAGEGH